MYYSKRTAFTLITVYLFLVGFASIQGDALPKPRAILAETSADTNNGDTSYAVFDGVVRLTSQGYSGGYGNLAIVRHFNGLETYYAHHRALLVEEGDTITAGTPLGIIGSTGRSGGPHLHFEARFLGLPMDPAVLVDSTQIPSKLILEREGRQYIIKQI